MNETQAVILIAIEATSLVLTVGAVAVAYFAVRKARREAQKAIKMAEAKAKTLKDALIDFSSALESI